MVGDAKRRQQAGIPVDINPLHPGGPVQAPVMIHFAVAQGATAVVKHDGLGPIDKLFLLIWSDLREIWMSCPKLHIFVLHFGHFPLSLIAKFDAKSQRAQRFAKKIIEFKILYPIFRVSTMAFKVENEDSMTYEP